MFVPNIVSDINKCTEDKLPGINVYVKNEFTNSGKYIFKQDWREEHQLDDGTFCKDYTCELWASSGACGLAVSSLPVSTCRHSSNLQIKEYCKTSCKNCGMYLCKQLCISILLI